MYVKTTRKDLLILNNSPRLTNFYFFNSNTYKHQEDFAICLMAHSINVKKKKKIHACNIILEYLLHSRQCGRDTKNTAYIISALLICDREARLLPVNLFTPMSTECLLCTDHHLSTGDIKKMEQGIYIHQTLGVILPAPASTLDQGE